MAGMKRAALVLFLTLGVVVVVLGFRASVQAGAMLRASGALLDSASARMARADATLQDATAAAGVEIVRADSAIRAADVARAAATVAARREARLRDSLALATTTRDSLTVALDGWNESARRAFALEIALDSTSAALGATRRAHALLSAAVDSVSDALRATREAHQRTREALRRAEPACYLIPGLLRCPSRTASAAVGLAAGVAVTTLVVVVAR